VTLRRALDGLPVQEKLSFCPGVVAPLQLTQMYPSDSCRADLLPLLPSSDWNCAEGLFVISNSRGRSENTSVYVFLHDFSSSRLLQACPSLLPSHAPTTVLPQRSKTCQNPRVCVPRSLLRLPSLSLPRNGGHSSLFSSSISPVLPSAHRVDVERRQENPGARPALAEGRLVGARSWALLHGRSQSETTISVNSRETR